MSKNNKSEMHQTWNYKINSSDYLDHLDVIGRAGNWISGS